MEEGVSDLLSPAEGSFMYQRLNLVLPSAPVDSLGSAGHEGTSNGEGTIDHCPTTPRRKRFIQRLPPVITLLRSSRLLVALLGTVVQATLITAIESTLPLYTRDVFHFTATGAGIVTLSNVLSHSVFTLLIGICRSGVLGCHPAELRGTRCWYAISRPKVVVQQICVLTKCSGSLCDKYGPKWIATTGYILACPFMILLRLPTVNEVGQVVLMCALLAIVGLALCLQITPMMAEVTYILVELEKERPGRFGRNGGYAQAVGLTRMQRE